MNQTLLSVLSTPSLQLGCLNGLRYFLRDKEISKFCRISSEVYRRDFPQVRFNEYHLASTVFRNEGKSIAPKILRVSWDEEAKYWQNNSLNWNSVVSLEFRFFRSFMVPEMLSYISAECFMRSMLPHLEIGFPRLQEIYFDCWKHKKECHTTRNESFCQINAACPHLRILKLGCSAKISDEALQSANHNLTSIDLHFNREISDKGLIRLSETCPHLKSINIERCDTITDEGIIQFANKCKEIVDINLYSKFKLRISSVGLNHLVSHCDLSRLEIGTLRDMKMADETLELIGRHCPSLMTLKIAACGSISDNGIKFLVDGCKILKILFLLWCDNITDVGIRQLARTTLEKVFLDTDEVLFSDRAVNAWAISSKTIRYIKIKGVKRREKSIIDQYWKKERGSMPCFRF